MKRNATILVFLFATVAGAAGPAAKQQLDVRNSGSASGVGHLHAGEWGIVRATVHNRSDRDQEASYAIRFKHMPDLQFVGPVWVPPHSLREVYVPVRGAESGADRKSVASRASLESMEGEVLLIDVSRQPEKRIARAQTQLMARSDKPVTAIIPSLATDGIRTQHVATAMRVATNLSTRVTGLRSGSVPHFTAGWRGLDQLVVSRRRPGLDSAQMESLRQWVVSGGRVWIMIDQVDPEFAASLLREAWQCSIVDTVALTDVCIRRDAIDNRGSWPRTAHSVRVDRNGKIDLDGRRLAGIEQFTEKFAADLAGAKTNADRTVFFSHADQLPHVHEKAWRQAVTAAGGIIVATQRTYEEPVAFSRLFAPGWEVLHTVNGWPASMRRRYGRGWVMMTTLAPRGWMRVREALDTKNRNQPARAEASRDDSTAPRPLVYPAYYPRPALRELANWFNRLPVNELVPQAPLRQMAGSQIDYRVMSRRTVIAVLALFVLGLVGVAAGLNRRRQLEYLGVVGGVAAVCVSFLLVAMGHKHRHKIPLTMASVHVVQLPRSQPYATVYGVLGIYTPDEGSGLVHASSGATFWPDHLTQKNEPLRMVWSDLSTWTWKNLHLPSGEPRGGRLTHVVKLAEPVRAHMTFESKGVVGWIDPGVLLRCPATTSDGQADRLDDGEIPVALRNAFRDHGIDLSPTATVRSEQSGARWTIDDDSQLYRVATEAGGFTVPAFADLEDLLLLTPRGRLVPTLTGGAKFTATGADVLAGEDFMASHAGMITDVQQRRAQVVRVLPKRLYDVTAGRRDALAARVEPTLLVWTNSLDLGFELAHPHTRRDASLLVIPVQIHRPKPGTRVSLPAPFITQGPTRRPEDEAQGRSRSGARRSHLYSNGEWIETTSAGNIMMRFQLPPEVWPMHVSNAELTIRIRARDRRLVVAHGTDEDRVVVYDDFPPEETFTIDLTTQNVVGRFDVRGGLDLNISVSEATQGSPVLSTWQMLHLDMTADGVAEDRSVGSG